MEYFEKAHVSKRSPLKKDTKNEAMVKNQLKQMLYGYKQSDNELIKNSGNAFSDVSEVHRALDDSTSVSGFSDLDLTKSDNEEDVTAAVPSQVSDENISSSLNTLRQSGDHHDIDDIEEELNKHVDYLDPISEGDEDVSITEDTDASEYSNTSADVSLLELISSPSSQSVSYSDSEEFDPDGSLASKIMQKLEKQSKSSPKCKKRKLDVTSTPKIKKDSPKENIKDKLNKHKNKNTVDVELENLVINDTDEEIIEDLLDSNTKDSESSDISSPFVSITATEMPDQSLDDILGDYKHPTVRNPPCEKQNVVSSTNNSGIFSTDDNMQVEDIDSLIPEIGEDLIAEDIELDLEATVDNLTQPSKELTDSFVYSIPESIDTELNSSKIDSISPIRMYYTKDNCIVILQYPSELFINGKVKIKPLGGTIEVFGHILKEEVNLYSPNNSFAHCLKTVKVENVYYGLFSRLTSCGLSVCDAEEIVTSLGEYDGVVCISPLKDAKMDFVDRHFPADVFTRLKIDGNAHRLTKMSDKSRCNIYASKPSRSFETYIEWDEAISCGLKNNSRGIVCGGKGLGKSTFVRYYINSVLDKGPVLVVDLDPGQAEFTVAGCISATVVTAPLLGPNFTHLKTPDISYNIGMINTMDNTFRYASAVRKLIEKCHTKFSSLPWIVNTMGMTNHMGLKFILLAIIHAQPTFVVQIDSKIMKKRFECSLEAHAIRMLYENCKYDRLFQKIYVPEDLDYNFILTKHVDGAFKHDTSLSPRDERYLNFLAYFGQLVDNESEDILGIIPYEVSLSDLNIVTNVNVSRDAVLKVINGKIVALCQLATTDKGKVFTLRDNAPLCHGHGLVRGVDFNNNLVYLLTPVAADRLSAVNALVYSDWAPELQGTERALAVGLPVPYRGAAQDKHKQHMLAPRRRFNPLQLLKMSRSA